MNDNEQGPLAGVTVADFTHVIAGPYCSMLLADAGADVLKIEPPGGEYARVRGPQRVGLSGAALSSYGAAVTRGKRSIGLDLKNPAGREIAERLIGKCDVVIENFSPGTMDRLGLKFSDLRQQFPRLITVSISLWGGYEDAQDLAARGGLSLVAESEGSIGAMVRDRNGEPVPLRAAVADMASGLAAYGAVVTALLNREYTGHGSHIEIPMVRTMLSFNSVNIAGVQMPTRNPDEGFPAALGLFPTKNGYVAIGVSTDKMWAKLAKCIGRPELATDPRYANYTERDRRVSEVNEMLRAWTRQRDSEEIVELFGPTGLPCGRVNRPEEVIGSERFRKLGWLWPADDGVGGHIDIPANPLGLHFGSDAIPQLGEHTDEILSGILGMDEMTRLDMRIRGAFGGPA